MKLILIQPAIPRFQWELEVLLTNIRQFTDMEVVMLFKEKNFTVPLHFEKKWGCSVFTFADKRDQTDYIPSIRPWLWWQYLAQHPEAEQETYLYIDSDVIFREWPDFATLPVDTKRWFGSDCSGYIGADYLLKCEKGPEIVENMARICGITVDQLKATPGAGAQWVIKNPTAAFWERAYNDSNAIHNYFKTLDSNVQKWTAEMWAQLFGMTREGIEVIIDHEQLDFCMATDPIEKWDTTKIMHNAGVTDSAELFYKGNYIDRVPFGENFDYVNPAKCSSKYVEAIKKVIV